MTVTTNETQIVKSITIIHKDDTKQTFNVPDDGGLFFEIDLGGVVQRVSVDNHNGTLTTETQDNYIRLDITKRATGGWL